MSHQTAQKISKETNHSVEWSPNREYVVWPQGVPCANAKEARNYIWATDNNWCPLCGECHEDGDGTPGYSCA